jgi:hypothetical protein
MSDDTTRLPLRGVVTGDPLKKLAVGAAIGTTIVGPGESNARTEPADVKNWGYFQGALLAIHVTRGAVSEIAGTAAMIAPGLALSATHVFADQHGDLSAIGSGEVTLGCVGVRDGSLDVWNVRSIAYDSNDDLAFLSLELASDLPEGWTFTQFALTTRAPKTGEHLTILGYRFKDVSAGGAQARGDLYVARGTVRAVYPKGRDGHLMKWPTIEIECGSLNGMSGGAVLDSDGLLMGIISKGIVDITYAAWVIGAFPRQLDIPWPPGMYPRPVRLVDLSELALRIVGREAVRKTGPDSTEYQSGSTRRHLRLGARIARSSTTRRDTPYETGALRRHAGLTADARP